MGGLTAHCSKANKLARLVERKVCFISGANNWWGRVVDICRKADSPHDKPRVRASIDRVEGVACRNSTVISNSHLQLVISGLASIILVVLGTVNLYFQCELVPIFFYSQFLELWQLTSWVQSDRLLVNFSTWCCGIYKTACRRWLRILSIALEKELKILDYA